MGVIKVQKKNHSKLQIDCDDKGIIRELSDIFKFHPPNYQYSPKFKNKVWDGYIRLFDQATWQLPLGLYPRLEQYCNKVGYDIESWDSAYGMPGDKEEIDLEFLTKWLRKLDVHNESGKIEFHDYQILAVYRALTEKRIGLLSPTSSGKSLIMYALVRWHLEFRRGKILLVVPTTSLVEQMFSDFKEYSKTDDQFNVDEECYRIYGDASKEDIEQRVIISTWQGVYKLPYKWFLPFEMILGDELHHFKADSLKKIMNSSINAEYRIGATGTLDGSAVHQLVIEGLFGKIHQVITTKELQERGTIAQLDINMIVLDYPHDVKKKWRGKQFLDYQKEVDFLVTHENRNKFITNLATSLEGNTLVLFNFIEKHGLPLHQMALDKTDQPVYLVYGGVDTEDREKIRKIVETEDNAIVYASFGTFSTGVNIRRLHNVILTSPSKSKVRILQSIGRGLRKSNDGMDMTLWDLVDDLTIIKKKNYSFRHGAKRLKIYEKEGFKVRTKRIPIQ